MKLLNLTIYKLFDIFNHTINYDQDERITILTAPNGYGKSMSLKIIYNLFNKRFDFFIKLPFKKIIFTFDNNKFIEIQKEINEDDALIKFVLKDKNQEISSFKYSSNLFISQFRKTMPMRKVEEFIPEFMERNRDNSDEWKNNFTNEILSFSEIIYRYSDYIPEDIIRQFDIDIPSEFNILLEKLQVYFIQEQRIILREPISNKRFIGGAVIKDTIERHAYELSEKMKEIIYEYVQVAQSLDSSFPKRLFQEKTLVFDEKVLKTKLKSLQEQRDKTYKYGFLKLNKDSFFEEDEIRVSDAKVLSLYIKDSEKKLAVFSDLVNKIELFTKILNERRFNFKRIEIDKEKGFVFKSQNDSILQLTELSSGEQHEVILLFELLFKATENSLVLIDEPEISLHVVWQKEFLNDIKEIIDLKKIDIVIATHSPQIINERWDLTVNLEASEIE